MKKVLFAVALMLTATSAQASSDLCNTFNLSKDGKPLAGAALSSRMGKCDKVEADCTTKAIDKNNKPLAGAAKTASVKKCVTDGMAY